MGEARDKLVWLRQMSFDRTAAATSRAASELKRAHQLLDVKKNSAHSIEDQRNSISNELQALPDARWLAHLWAFDRLLTADLKGARDEVDRAESNLTGRLEDLCEEKRRLAAAQARLLAAQNLQKRRRRATSRRRERRMEEQAQELFMVSGFAGHPVRFQDTPTTRNYP